ncbi:hypothetical protein BH10BAC4_BH10BAC4_08720 [soil metagenome]
MKAGHLIVIGLINWILFSCLTNIWIYKSKAHILSAIVVGAACVIWLTDKTNRQNLFETFLTPKTGDLFRMIRIGIIAIFSFLVIVAEVSKFWLSQSEGFSFVKSEILKNKILIEKVGEIEYIAIGNSFSVGLSFKDSEKRLSTSLIVFGILGQINVDVEATKTDDWRIRDIKIN